MLWPNRSRTRPTVTSGYGTRVHPVTGKVKKHMGTDMVGFFTVHAVAAGTVLKVGTPVGWWGGGTQVWIQHDGFISRSLHLVKGSPLVKVGQKVAEGQALGAMGMTGTATGVHLHLEIVVNGKQIDPVPFIAGHVGTAGGSTASVGGADTATEPEINLEDDMILIESLPDRGRAVIGPGYFRKLSNEEELTRATQMVSKTLRGNAREFDVWKAIALQGSAPSQSVQLTDAQLDEIAAAAREGGSEAIKGLEFVVTAS